MSMITVTIPNLQVQLTVEQLVAAVRQLKSQERAQVAKALADTELDAKLTQLITELYNRPPVTDITDADIQAEVQAVRQQRH